MNQKIEKEKSTIKQQNAFRNKCIKSKQNKNYSSL